MARVSISDEIVLSGSQFHLAVIVEVAFTLTMQHRSLQHIVAVVAAIVGFVSSLQSQATPLTLAQERDSPTTAVEPTSPRHASQLLLSDIVEITIAGKSISLRMVKAGEVHLGNTERGLSKVRLTRSFFMSECEVTQATYAAVMGDNPSLVRERRTSGPAKIFMEDVTTTVMSGGQPTLITQKRPKVVRGDEKVTQLLENPVENVTWEQAVEFCTRANSKARETGVLPNGMVLRLPTEAEWELAHRRGRDLAHADSAIPLEQSAWAKENASGSHQATRSKMANAIGLFDLDGNVAEWCLDAWSVKVPIENIPDPIVLDVAQRAILGTPSPRDYTVQLITDTTNIRVVRGGSWRTPQSELQDQPVRIPHSTRADDIGFRIVISAPLSTPVMP